MSADILTADRSNDYLKSFQLGLFGLLIWIVPTVVLFAHDYALPRLLQAYRSPFAFYLAALWLLPTQLLMFLAEQIIR